MADDLGAKLERGLTLPAAWYSDRDVLRRERERIFARTWQWAGRVDDVAEPGRYFSCRAGHIPVVVTRDRAGTLNALVNVCRHRGHIVVQGAGRRETLQCPYHAWTYGLDGALRAAPRSEREPGFDRDGLSLVPVSVDTWGPLVFVNPDRDAGPLAKALGELPAAVAASGVDLGELRFHHRGEYEIAANWKVVVENYLECYHCPVAHPGFSSVIDVDPDSYELTAYERVSVQRGPARADGKRKPYATGGEVEASTSVFVWPNFTLDIIPGPPNAVLGVFLPLDEERTLGIADYYFAEGIDEDVVADMVAFNEQVGREDNSLVESVQFGLASGAVEHGRLLTSSEHLIAHFQRLVHRALG